MAAVRWLRRWRQRDIVMSAAAWRRRATGDDNKDDDDGDGDNAMGSNATGYDNDDEDDGDGRRQRRRRWRDNDEDNNDGDGATGDRIRRRWQEQWRRTTKTTGSMATAQRATA